MDFYNWHDKLCPFRKLSTVNLQINIFYDVRPVDMRAGKQLGLYGKGDFISKSETRGSLDEQRQFHLNLI